jgi:cytidylate kinase
MLSIAIFPCLFTGAAGIVGELSNALDLKVYTDAMILADMKKHYDIPVKDLDAILFGKLKKNASALIEKENYAKLLQHYLHYLQKKRKRNSLHYGLHTCLLTAHKDRIVQVLITDTFAGRQHRGIKFEGLSEEEAAICIKRHDKKAHRWTQFLFQKNPYDESLYDLILRNERGNSTDITNKIRSFCKTRTNRYLAPPQPHLMAQSAMFC